MSSAAGARTSGLEKVAFPDPKERTPAILIVDDEPLIRMAISDFLQECGFKTLEASDASEAVQMINSYAIVLDLVFSDIQMPGEMDGFGLATWIRQNRPQLPVILCSGDSKKSTLAHELCEGEPFLAKPFDFKLVLAQIRQTLDKRKTNH
jgi:CheY-like chemotaxis protein